MTHTINQKLEEERSGPLSQSEETFKKRHYLHTILVIDMKARNDCNTITSFPAELKAFIDAEGYYQHKIFNADETGLFWKYMTIRTYISKEERTVSGFRAGKDHLNMMCGYTAGDCKCKPLLTRHRIPYFTITNYNISKNVVIGFSNVCLIIPYEDNFPMHKFPKCRVLSRCFHYILGGLTVF